ncbi:TetR/AcrR family transcriptional regulator [Corynebacterium aquatimens]|uniref:AcrR family transcriptional regulator n=1 Tax=Corynebacterium aquatimens TaxID=1190508 RepID=A0A931E2R8_9CORY|nr:TetR/AcrR family transcriptional regulator [Corynebacterium aquatimens]MBG6122156.1 AcrR family transcriptional regulator [Corynebacterium aquatimens]WJY65303.1 HTH-type transcriptional repressor KstR2 [Corynebacterium aquatimens]
MPSSAGRASAGRTPSISEELDWRVFPPLELDEFLTAALKLINERGYHATSVRNIVKEVGVTIPSFYYHYENKQQMLVALMEYSMDVVDSRIDAALEEAGDDVVQQLVNLTESACLIMAYYRELTYLDSEIRSLEEDNMRRYAQRRDRSEELMRGIVKEGCEQGIFHTRYPADVSRALFSAIQGIALWYRMDGPDTPEEMARKYAHFALALVEADPHVTAAIK